MNQRDASALRLMVVSDGVGDPDRLCTIAQAAFEGGATALQVREPAWALEEAEGFVRRVLPLAREHSAKLLVNSLAVPGAHGVHLPVRFHEAKASVAHRIYCGFAAHDPRELELAVAAQADYAMLAPVFATSSKPDVEPLGLDRARAWTQAVAADIPVLWLGGITAETAPNLSAEPCVGVAVRSAICSAPDPRAATVAIRVALGS